ncbi:hypothetical protein [Streptomyces sp. NPDC101234]|uniref:hypothetical protein n=1 Tax=Streptomyces sp. NPDC101234 TaxID=3366138 RepID=UPI003828D9F1
MSKTVLVTGASTGTGEALTLEYAARGWNVATDTATGAARTTAGSTPQTPTGSPRADLYKELDDLGLL